MYICGDEFAIRCFDNALGEVSPLIYDFIVNELVVVHRLAKKVCNEEPLDVVDAEILNRAIFRLESAIVVILRRYPQA